MWIVLDKVQSQKSRRKERQIATKAESLQQKWDFYANNMTLIFAWLSIELARFIDDDICSYFTYFLTEVLQKTNGL